MRWMIASVAVLAIGLLAGCGGETVDSEVSAVLDADLQKGTVMLTCRTSSTGTCHALFSLGNDVTRLEAAQGSAATASGVNDLTRYCVGATAPGDGCRQRPLMEGEQIVRNRSTRG